MVSVSGGCIEIDLFQRKGAEQDMGKRGAVTGVLIRGRRPFSTSRAVRRIEIYVRSERSDRPSDLVVPLITLLRSSLLSK